MKTNFKIVFNNTVARNKLSEPILAILLLMMFVVTFWINISSRYKKRFVLQEVDSNVAQKRFFRIDLCRSLFVDLRQIKSRILIITVE